MQQMGRAWAEALPDSFDMIFNQGSSFGTEGVRLSIVPMAGLWTELFRVVKVTCYLHTAMNGKF